MKKTLFIFSIFLLFIFGNYLFLEKNAVGAIIDFEDFAYPGNDGLSISDQYLGTYGVEFYLGNGGTPNLEQVGDLPGDDFVGFWNDAKAAADIEAVGFEGGLGNYYLRLNGLRLQDVPIPALVIEFSEPTMAVSAEIWDIDAWEPQGAERWRVTALDQFENFLASVESPLGLDSSHPESLDGKPWKWSLAPEEGDISFLLIEWTGTKETGIGLAFDNFNTTAAPIPGAIWLFGSGILGMVFIRRRLKN